MDTVKLQVLSKTGEVKAELTAEVADTPETRRQGLSNRRFLPQGYGMLFDKVGAYWMKDVEFPLDIVFVTKEGEILERQHMPTVAPDAPTRPLYVPSSDKAAHALEIPVGWWERKGLETGDRLQVASNELV